MQADTETILRYFRILGLPVNSSIEELKNSRKKLIQKFHPDKHPMGWSLDTISLEVRIQLVQESFDFISEHYDEIQKRFTYVSEQVLTSQVNIHQRSQFVYKEIAKYIA